MLTLSHPYPGDSAIVVKDLPMEDGADQGADDRLAAFDSQMGILAENAKIEELSRGSGAEPDLLMDDAVKQAVQEHEDAAVKTGGQQLDQMEAAGSRQAESEEEAGEEPEIEGGQEQQGSLDYEEDEDEDSARRMLLQKPKKKRKRGRKARNPEDVPGSVSRSLPDEVLPAEQEEAAAAGLQWPEDPQQKDGGSGQDDNEDREIVMTDVSKAERQAEQLSAMADPGDSDNFEEGLLSAAADEDADSDAAVRSQNAAEIEQGDDRAKGGRGGKRTEPGKRRRRRKGTGQGPRRAAGRPARKRGGAKGAGAAAVAEGGEPRLRRRKGKGKGRKSRGHGTGMA